MGLAARALVATVLVGMIAAGCGLDVVGVASIAADGGVMGPDGSTATRDAAPPEPDGEADTGTVTPPPPPPPGCECGLTVPEGWGLVAFAEDRSAGCAAGLEVVDRVTRPSAGPSACTCAACEIATRPSCNSGNFSASHNFGGTGVCNQTGNPRVTNGGNCQNYNGDVADFGRLVPPAPTGPSSCTAAGVANQSAAQAQPARVCAQVTASAGCACDPKLAPAYKACLRARGDQACPAAAPNKTLVGTSSVVACGPCPCDVTGATCSGSCTYFANQNCQGGTLSTLDSATCKAWGGGSYASYRWTGTANVTCAAGAPPAGTASLAGTETICCR